MHFIFKIDFNLSLLKQSDTSNAHICKHVQHICMHESMYTWMNAYMNLHKLL